MSKDIDIRIRAKTEGTGEVKKLQTQLSALGKIESFKKLKKDLEATKTAWAEAQIEAARLAKEITQTDAPTKDLTNRFSVAKKEAARLKTQFLQNQKSLHSLRDELNKAGINTKNLNAEQKKLSVSVARTKTELSKAAKINTAMGMLNVKPFKDIQREIDATKTAYVQLKNSGKLSMAELYEAKLNMKRRIAELKNETNGWANAITRAQASLAALAGLGYAAVKSISGFSEFSQRMAEVNTLLDVSKARFTSLSKEILDMSIRIPQTASELAAAEYDIISAGVALEKSAKVLELSAKAAVAGVTDTKTAVNAGVGVINAYGKDISELGNAYDVLFQTVKSGVTTFPALAQHIGEVLPSARAAGVAFEGVAASIAAMTKAGIRTPQAATAMKGAINAMAAPAPEAKKKFDELGITWKGLIPTLEAIKAKGLSVDQMRFLIPDVEARTGVLALTQNMDGLKEILGGMKGPAGAMNEAFDKMKDTPENQIKLFKNEISKLSIEIGGFLSKGLLPLLKETTALIESFRQVDPIAKSFITTLGTAGTAFILWKLGLASIVLGLEGLIVKAGVAAAGLMALAATSTAMGMAVAAGAALGVYELYKLGVAVDGAIKAYKHARESQENLFKTTDRVMEKYDEFKDVKLPDDITGTASEDLEDLSRSLKRARAYWIALYEKLRAKADETTMFGAATKEALAAQAELKKVDRRINQIAGDLKKIEESGKAAGEGMEAPAEAVRATSEQLKKFEEQAKQAYDYAKDQAEKYAKEVISWEEKIKYARMSTEDKIRELSRKGLSDEAQWNDEKIQADEKLYAAKEALRQKDYKLAEKLAKDAESLYAGLAQEVKGSDAGGNEVVKQSLEDSKKVAIKGVETVGNFIKDLYTEQKQNARDSQKEWAATADSIQAKLDEIAREREANVKIELKGLESAQSKINALVKDETKYITVVTKTVSANQDGGPVLAASTGAFIRRAGKLGGYGGGDKIKSLLEAGEFIIRKEAVGKYGASFFSALNSMQLNMPDIQGAVRARIGGLISSLPVSKLPVPAFSAGGAAGSPSETLLVRFQAGDVEAPVKITDPSSRAAMKKMAREMSRMRMIRGK
ncbi:phage tail tape measure protein [uncultured Desulfobacter sp.]|uniref:phage tail tape measure protein n=1 Tax=uncultured Desulfobacter sp. TaxID=240139 RepID=UPI0029F4BDE0|nr:phage tail tape measure protein [uncultured Desulfobacter sp.]